jgi:hypothetical protein
MQYYLFDWQGKRKWYYDIIGKSFYVDPRYEQEFCERSRKINMSDERKIL